MDSGNTGSVPFAVDKDNQVPPGRVVIRQTDRSSLCCRPAVMAVGDECSAGR